MLGYLSVSIIHQTPTWTTGSLTHVGKLPTCIYIHTVDLSFCLFCFSSLSHLKEFVRSLHRILTPRKSLGEQLKHAMLCMFAHLHAMRAQSIACFSHSSKQWPYSTTPILQLSRASSLAHLHRPSCPGGSSVLTFNIVHGLLQEGFHGLEVNVKDNGLDGRAAGDSGAHVGELFFKLVPQAIEWLHLRAIRHFNLETLRKLLREKRKKKQWSQCVELLWKNNDFKKK